MRRRRSRMSVNVLASSAFDGPVGYTGKLLGPTEMRRAADRSRVGAARALAVKLVVVDEQQAERIRRWARRSDETHIAAAYDRSSAVIFLRKD
jgi:hypothetical protein